MRELLFQAKEEIVCLRRNNEIMRAQLAIVDVFAAACGLKSDSQAMSSIDIVWKIEKELAKVDKLEKMPMKKREV